MEYSTVLQLSDVRISSQGSADGSLLIASNEELHFGVFAMTTLPQF